MGRPEITLVLGALVLILLKRDRINLIDGGFYLYICAYLPSLMRSSLFLYYEATDEGEYFE